MRPSSRAAPPWSQALAASLLLSCARPSPPGQAAPHASRAPIGSGSVAAAQPAPVDALRVTDPTRLEIVGRTPAWFAVGEGGRVFALDARVEALLAYDLAGGAALWRAPLGVAASGRVRLLPGFGAHRRVLVHVRNELLLFDRDTGASVAREAGPFGGDKVRFTSERGACSFGSECALQLVDCDTARPFGPYLRIAETHLYQKLGAPHDTVCWGPLGVIGRGGNTVVAIADGRTQEPPRPGAVTLGIDAISGKVQWSRAFGCERCATTGVSPDGVTCWLADPEGALEVFECATGQRRFVQQLTPAASQPELYVAWTDRGLFVSTANEARLLDPKQGKARWTRPLPNDGLALPVGVRLELDAYSTWQQRSVLLLEPETGAERARFVLPGYTELVQSEDLGLRVRGGPAFDRKGAARAWVEPAPLLTLDREVAPRRVLAGAKPVAEVTTDVAVVGAQGDRAALFLWGQSGAGELVFVRVKAP